MALLVIAQVGYFALRAQSARYDAETAQQRAETAATYEAAARMQAVAESQRAATSEADARTAEATAVAANAEVERLTRGIRADQLTANALKVVNENPPLALLLAAEGLRTQHDFARTQPYTVTRTSYDFALPGYVRVSRVITREDVVGSAQTNMHEVLSQVGGKPLPTTRATLSPDGHWLAAASDNNTTRLWDLTTAEPALHPIVLQGHAAYVRTVAFSPDGHWLATGSEDNTTRLWDLRVADPGRTAVVIPGAVSVAAFSPNSHWLAIRSDLSTNLFDLTGADPAQHPIVLPGHEDNPYSGKVAFSPDGRWLATTTSGPDESDNTACLWDLLAVDPPQHSIILRGHRFFLTAVAFSPNGQWLVTASSDGTSRLWDLTAADPARHSLVLTGSDSVAFSPDGHWLATAAGDTVRLRDLTFADPSQNPIVLPGHVTEVWDLAFSPDGRWLVTASWDTTARLWDLTATDVGRDPILLQGQAGYVWSVAFSPDSHWLATASGNPMGGSSDNTARLWDLSTTEPAQEPIVLRGHSNCVSTVAFSPDGHWLITNSWDNTIRLWDFTADPSMRDPSVFHDVGSVDFSLDGHWLAIVSNGIARLWNVIAGNLSQHPIVLPPREGSVIALAFSPDGHWLATTSGENTVSIWDLSAADPAKHPTVLSADTGHLRWVAFSPTNRWLSADSDDNKTWLWRVPAANPPSNPIVLLGHAAAAKVFSPDGRWLATRSNDSATQLWDLTAANPTQHPIGLEAEAGSIDALAFSPDSHWLAMSSHSPLGSGDTRLWDLTAAADPAQAPVVLESHQFGTSNATVIFSPDGRWFAATWGDNTVSLWDLSTADRAAQPIMIPQAQVGPQRDLVFSPDSHWLVIVSHDLHGSSDAYLWDLTTERASNPIALAGVAGGVSVLAFSPDGDWLAMGSAAPYRGVSDDATRLWELTAADPAKDPIVLKGSLGNVPALAFSPGGRWLAALAFSPDGRWLATTSQDSTTRLWRWRIDDLIDLACNTAGRNMTQEEWQRYMGQEQYRATCPQWPASD